MRILLLLLAIVFFPGAVAAVDDPDKYEAYRQRLKERRIYALRLRREIYGNRTYYYRTPVIYVHPPSNSFNYYRFYNTLLWRINHAHESP